MSWLTNTKKHLPTEFKHYARLGDSILNMITMDLFYKYNNSVSIHIIHELTSNAFISQFIVPMKFRFKKHNHTSEKALNGLKGDRVEFYIWFLFENYGSEAVERYLVKQYKRLEHLL